MKHNNKHYSLHDVKAEVDTTFYRELSERALRALGHLGRHDLDKEIPIDTLKEALGINYETLAKVISLLSENKAIEVLLTEAAKADVEKKYGAGAVSLQLTSTGIATILHCPKGLMSPLPCSR
jgi:hypothetical protein